MTDAHGVARDQLRAFIERIERLEEEKKTIADDIKDVYGEAKGTGFDTVIMKRVISLRKKDAQQRMEEEAVLDTYLAALGMIAQPDLFEEPHHPETGEVIDPKLAQTIVTGMQTETGRKALIAAVDIMIAREETEEQASNGSNAGRPSLAARDDEESAVSNPVANVEEEATGAIAVASYDPAIRTDEDSERQHSSTVGFADDCRTGGKEQSDASAAPVGDAAADAHGIPATNSEKNTAAHGDAGRHSLDSVSPQAASATTGSVDANTGGDHVTAPQYAATHQAGGLVQNPPAKPLRPNCLRPDNCAGFGSNHCYSCGKAAKADEVAA